MVLIIGGAYQGKLDFAKRAYGIRDADVFTCTEESGIVFGARCLNRLEDFTLWCVRNGEDAVALFEAHRAAWENSVLICQDIFCGVVPLGAENRAWREMTGRLCAFLAREAQSVFRIFCGLEQRLK